MPTPPRVVVDAHSRRKDFKNFKGHTFTPLENYQAAIEEVRQSIQALLDAPEDSDRGGKPRIKRFEGVSHNEYKILVTSDERPESEFRERVAKETDWTVIEHVSSARGRLRLLGAEG